MDIIKHQPITPGTTYEEKRAKQKLSRKGQGKFFRVITTFIIFAFNLASHALWLRYAFEWTFFGGFPPGYPRPLLTGIPLAILGAYLVAFARHINRPIKSKLISVLGNISYIVSGIAISLSIVLIVLIHFLFFFEILSFLWIILFSLFMVLVAILVNLWNWGPILIVMGVAGLVSGGLTNLFPVLVSDLTSIDEDGKIFNKLLGGCKWLGIAVALGLGIWAFPGRAERLIAMERPPLYLESVYGIHHGIIDFISR